MTTLNSNHDDVFSLPKPEPTGDKKRKRNVRKKHSEILSTTPMKEELVLKETNKIRRKEKEVARVKRRISLEDQNQEPVLKNQNKKQAKTKQKKRTKKQDSDSEDEEIVIPFSDDEVVREDDVEQSSDFDALTEVPKKHDYMLVEFKIRENNIVCNVGKILTDKDENDEF
ncbi:hypothetical protein JTB14_024693 [Gonioctena quinquepunctata]|nr:hypothetical protein JTB14_024693 [Gonioctena quinquepunctata]